jgi:hypothetical protein
MRKQSRIHRGFRESSDPFTIPTTATSAIDWEYLDWIQPTSFSYPRDIRVLKRISYQFVHSVFFPFASQARLEKLLPILQLIILSIGQENESQKKELHSLRHENDSLRSRLAEQPEPVKAVVADRCPVCGIGFKSIFFLDRHIFNSHPEISSLWQTIRTPQLPGFRPPPARSAPPKLFNETAIQDLLQEIRHRSSSTERRLIKWLRHRMDKFETVLRQEIGRIDQATDSLRRPVPEAIVQPIQNIETIEPRNRRKSFVDQPLPEKIEHQDFGISDESSGTAPNDSHAAAPTGTGGTESLPHVDTIPAAIRIQEEEEEEEEEENNDGKAFGGLFNPTSRPQPATDDLDATMPPPPEALSDGEIGNISSEAPAIEFGSGGGGSSEHGGFQLSDSDPQGFTVDGSGTSKKSTTDEVANPARPYQGVVDLDALDLGEFDMDMTTL